MATRPRSPISASPRTTQPIRTSIDSTMRRRGRRRTGVLAAL
jgi:hypothetical protein